LSEVFRSNLKALDETIQACQQMVSLDPDNVTARTYLLTAYQEKVSFLDECMGIKRSSAGKPAGISL